MKKFVVMLIALLVSGSISGQSCLPDGITFSTQQQINSFKTLYPGCTQIEGDVTISGYNITNLNGLNAVTSIGGSLNIICNEALASLSGLNRLTYIGGNLFIEGNMILQNLAGLNSVVSIGGNIQVSCNVALANLSGLDQLTSINGRLLIDDNDALTDLTGLNNVVSISGALRIIYNDALISLTGLENLNYIAGNLGIGGLGHLGGMGNLSLASLTALQNVTSIGGNIDIGYNPSLASLDGLDNIGAGSIMGLSVYDNDTLSDCNVESICGYLANPSGNVYISNNASGCNSLEELEATCALLSSVTIDNHESISVFPNPSNVNITVETEAISINSRLSVLNSRGQEVIRCAITAPTTQVSIADLPNGIYFIRIFADKAVITEKFVRH